MASHKLTPIDKKLLLTKYGYGRSPKAKAEALERDYKKRYNDKFISKLQVVESPLARSQHDPKVRLNVAPGCPKSQYLESIEKAEAEKEALRLKRERQREMRAMQRAANSNSFKGTQEQQESLNDSYDDGGRSRADSESSVDHSDLLDHENFNLDEHLNVVEDMMEAEAAEDDIDLNSDVVRSGEDASMSHSASRLSIMSSNGSDAPNYQQNIYTENTKAVLKEQLTTLSLSMSSEEHLRLKQKEMLRRKDPTDPQGDQSLNLQGASSKNTGMSLSLGGGSRLQEGSVNLKSKQTPAMRKRFKKMKEKEALTTAGGPIRDIVIAPHGKNLDYFKLKKIPLKPAQVHAIRDPELCLIRNSILSPQRLPPSREFGRQNEECGG